eukprot:scpid17785/ scgid1696/ 
MNEMETSGTSGEATGRPISPFELANGKNYLQGQLDSIVRRLAENESLVRSLGDMLATERERKLSATSSQTTVELGGSASGETVKRGTREDAGRLAEKTVTHESSGNGAVPMWTADSRKRKPSTKSTQHALPTGTQSRHAVEVCRERHSDTKEVLRLLREFPLRSKEVQHIRQELQKSRRHAAENAQYAAEYHERHEHLESQLRSVSGECEQLRAELVKAVHDSTEVDVAVMVADLQCSIVELQSDVAGLCGRAADAERKSAMADEENASLKKSLQAKDDEVLQQQRVIDRTAQELANCHHQLKKAAKAQKASASEADVWQQKFLSMTRDMRQKEALVNQHQAAISGLKNRVQAEDVNQHQKIVELEQALSSYQEQVQQLEMEVTGSRSQVDTLQEQISNLCPRSAVECEKQRQLMQNNIQDLAASLEQDNLQHTQHMDAIAKLKTILQTSQTQVATLEAENQKLSEEKSQLCDEVNTTVEQMAGEHQRWQDETNVLKEKLASAETALEQVQVENQALKEQCEASQLLEDVSLDARQLTQDLQTKCDEQSEKMRFSQLQSQLDEKTMEFNHTTAMLKEVNASNRDLRSALSATRADSKAKAESLRQAKLALEQEHTHGKQQLQEFLGNLQRVQAQLKGEGKEKKALTTRLQENEQELQGVQNKNVKLLKDLKDCRAALDDVHREKKSVASSLSRSEVECSELRESLTSKQSQLRQDRDEHLLHSRQLRHSLQAAKNKAEAASKRLQDATEALANAESRLKQRAAQVASLQEQLKTVRKTTERAA